ncbi:50S ribosomal protein L2 [Candidatus Beckwithbacteria bacterium RBG_13_42_9]|uniref:Large ribosomal subunit protein uL2 n=1 Tax=Candidatus Beckwithbacteria bacterium RBG_13_42_9 TaxID=1797457 RepID=A0A1F5E8Y5_9BACT|nr:MAG: 50S ribosomal protein L2 [Candidatus Beckwithbacteria bacterium RBG_13_42_9]
MSIRRGKPVTPGSRHRTRMDYSGLAKKPSIKRMRRILSKHSGRNSSGRVTVRHQGGRQKRFLRLLDFRRDKRGIIARVEALEYDPNRTANIALLVYGDGEKRYILAPDGLKKGDKLVASDKAEPKIGNALPLAKIPVGVPIHNLEMRPGKGGQIIRSAGVAAIIQAKENDFANVLLPSTEIRRIPLTCYATIGQVSNQEWKNISLGKAGRKRHMGIRPSVRGVAQNPNSHPHGGGEGRSGIGMPSPKSPWGKPTLGKKTRKDRRYSTKYIISKRKRK